MAKLPMLVLLVGALAACDRPAPPPHEHAAADATVRRPLYQCPMHPQIIRREPGQCPICGMALQRVDEREGGGSAVPGHAAFTLSADRQQLIGVTRAPVERRALVREIRAAATIANDPALYGALVEHREALRARGAFRGTSLSETVTGGETLARASVLKLRRLGIGERELAALAGVDPTTLILPGPRVWLYAQVFEEDVPLLAAGTPVTVDIPSQPGRTYRSTVFAVDPVVVPETRTVRVRALLETPDAGLRPDTYATATFEIALGEQLAIPRAAVLDSGTRRLVFVTDGTRFTPREVQLGRVAGDWVEVRDGVAAGEEVVTSANFLIDSESRLKAAVEAFGGDPGAHRHP
ncbi:MAG TPA: efflux RND transporter periplasmic adaptor subunit [Gaiellaceae bacterium]|nr:efflux RND transporter periplasmic adaptor subunit [Gaiellaceae bacterium]